MLPEVYEGWQTYAQTNHIDVNLALGIVVICAGNINALTFHDKIFIYYFYFQGSF